MKKVIKSICGGMLVRLCPKISRSLVDSEAVPRGIVETLISQFLIGEAAKSGNSELLRAQLSQYWKGDSGDAFYETFADRFESSFLGEHYSVVEALKEVAESANNEWSQVVELGCGDGQVLNHLSDALPGVGRFVGLDINPKIIEQNQTTYPGEKLEFVAGDGAEWIGRYTVPGTILVTYGGVMEYLLENELADIFAKLKMSSPVLVALVEPLYDGYDLTQETASRSSGLEHSFSHNHRYLLEKAGFEIEFQSEPQLEFRWMMIVAKG